MAPLVEPVEKFYNSFASCCESSKARQAFPAKALTLLHRKLPPPREECEKPLQLLTPMAAAGQSGGNCSRVQDSSRRSCFEQCRTVLVTLMLCWPTSMHDLSPAARGRVTRDPSTRRRLQSDVGAGLNAAPIAREGLSIALSTPYSGHEG